MNPSARKWLIGLTLLGVATTGLAAKGRWAFPARGNRPRQRETASIPERW